MTRSARLSPPARHAPLFRPALHELECRALPSTSPDALYLQTTVEVQEYEIALATVAVAKGDSMTQQYAKTVISANTQALAALLPTLIADGITNVHLSSQDMAAVQQLSQLTGTAFTSQFLKDTGTALVREASADLQEVHLGQDPMAMAYAQSQLPVIQQLAVGAVQLALNEAGIQTGGEGGEGGDGGNGQGGNGNGQGGDDLARGGHVHAQSHVHMHGPFVGSIGSHHGTVHAHTQNHNHVSVVTGM